MHVKPSDVKLLVGCSETRGGANIAALSLQCQDMRCRTDFADSPYPAGKVATHCDSERSWQQGEHTLTTHVSNNP